MGIFERTFDGLTKDGLENFLAAVRWDVKEMKKEFQSVSSRLNSDLTMIQMHKDTIKTSFDDITEMFVNHKQEIISQVSYTVKIFEKSCNSLDERLITLSDKMNEIESSMRGFGKFSAQAEKSMDDTSTRLKIINENIECLFEKKHDVEPPKPPGATENINNIAVCLKANPWSGFNDILKKTGLARSSLSRSLKKLNSDKIIEKKDGLYRLLRLPDEFQP